jgi:hypothetical protein
MYIPIRARSPQLSFCRINKPLLSHILETSFCFWLFLGEVYRMGGEILVSNKAHYAWRQNSDGVGDAVVNGASFLIGP